MIKHEYIMSLNKKNLKNIHNFIKKILIANNTANHKFNIIIKHVKYDDMIMTLKMNF